MIEARTTRASSDRGDLIPIAKVRGVLRTSCRARVGGGVGLCLIPARRKRCLGVTFSGAKSCACVEDRTSRGDR